MDGEVLYFDKERGTGFISGSDGNRYVFDVSDITTENRIAKGLKIVFEADNNRARKILSGFKAAEPQLASVPATDVAPAPPLRQPTPGILAYFRYCITGGFVRFRGRARRREYWSFALIAIIGFAVIGGLCFAAGAAFGYNESAKPTISIAALTLFWLFLVLPSLAVLVRRIHDIGLSGWFVLLALVPMVGSFIILVFTFIPSQKHENRWGPVPTGIHL